MNPFQQYAALELELQSALPFQRHSETSEAAAKAIAPKAATDRARVLNFLKARPQGATDEEMQIVLQMNPSTQRPRRVELCRGAQVFDSGLTRKTSSGRSATVWEAVF